MTAQLQVLNYILSKGDMAFIVVHGLTVDYFNNFKKEFNFINNHIKLYHQVPDLLTFLQSFPDFEVVEVNETEEYLLDSLFKERDQSFLIQLYNDARDLIVKGRVEEAKQKLIRSVDDLSVSGKLEAVDILDDISRYDEYVEKCGNVKDFYVTTGFKELDYSLGGGIDRKNSYFIISARPGIGKTLIAMKFAAAAANAGLRVGFYEGEMATTKISNRYDTIVSHISNASINQGNFGISNEYKRFLEDLKSNHSGNLFVLTRDKVGSRDVTVDILQGFVEKYKLDYLVVDQISLLDDSRKAKQEFEQVSNISKDLKNLQVKYQIPIIAVSQQKRSDNSNNPDTADLSLSDRLGQDATHVLFVAREDDVMRFKIAKARDGCIQNLLQYNVDYNKSTFDYLPSEDDKLLNIRVEDFEYGKVDYTPCSFSDEELPF